MCVGGEIRLLGDDFSEFLFIMMKLFFSLSITRLIEQANFSP